MSTDSILKKCSAVLSLLSVALLVCGTKACQEDYEVAGQVEVRTAVPTATTDEGEDGVGTVTPTATPTGSSSIPAAATETPASAGTPSPVPTTAQSIFGGGQDDGLLQELSKLGDGSANSKVDSASGPGGANWLGKGFSKDKSANSDPSDFNDSDGDGFTDDLENSSSTDPLEPQSFPQGMISTKYENRVRLLDRDYDGLSNAEELKLGTDPGSNDSDNDTRPDGAEVLSGGDPLKTADKYIDTDGDGLSDDYEVKQGLNPQSMDSDNDGLRDDLELVIGSHPLQKDTDGDGISDGKEYELESDPTIADAASKSN